MITLERISKIFPGDVRVVEDLCLEVKEGETLVLLGTSGCGKTTILKMINRLVEPTDGRILVEERDIADEDPIELRRRIGYAIQHIGLFPHMTIAENVAVVPKLSGWTRERIDARVDELLSMVGLDPAAYRDRFPRQLSGGQRQRVGVARALAADPPIVLMDEPFGALDPITREQIQDEFVQLRKRLNKTIVFVTHDVYEAMKVGDRIALIHHGRVQQVGTPDELVEKPANEFVNTFFGRHRYHLMLMAKDEGELRSLLRLDERGGAR